MRSAKSLSKGLAGLAAAAAIAGITTPAQAELPPAAQAAFDKGLVAAGQQEWEVALQSFQDARKAAPDAPEVFYNLGLTESKMPGRELRAIAWFGAYLSAEPKAANAIDVRAFIAALQVRNEGDIRRLIKTLESGAREVPDKLNLYVREVDVALLWAGLGDIPDTERLVGSAIADDDNSKLWDKNWHEAPLYNRPLALAHAYAGDWAGAKAFADRIPDLLKRTEVDVDLGDLRRKSGDAAGARVMLQFAASAAAGGGSPDTQSPWIKPELQSKVAAAQARAGDLAGALATIQAAQQAAQMVRDANIRDGTEKSIGDAQLAAGDIPGAQKTQAIIVDQFMRDYFGQKISEASKSARPVAARHVWTEKLDSVDDCNMSMSTDDDDCGLKTPIFLDFSGELKSLATGNPDHSFRAIAEAARRVIAARNSLDRMLKHLAIQSAGT